MKTLFVLTLIAAAHVSFAQSSSRPGQPVGTSRCEDTYNDADYILNADRSSRYYETGIIQVALRLKDRAEDLNDHARYLKKISDKKDRDSVWSYLNVNQNLNADAVDKKLSPPLDGLANYAQWSRDIIRNQFKPDSSVEDLRALLHELQANAEIAYTNGQEARRARNDLKVEIDRTQETVNRNVGPILQELDSRSDRIAGLTDRVLDLSYDLVGSDYFRSWRLDPQSKLGRLRGDLDDLRSCLR